MGSVAAIKIEPLNDANYMVWSRQMRALLIERDLFETTEKDAPATDKPQQKAVALLTLNITPALLYLVDDTKSAYANWTAISKHYAAKQTSRVVLLKKELATLTMQPKEAVCEYYSRTLVLRDRLEMAGVKVQADDLKLQLLAGLPSPYAPVIETLETASTTLSEVFARLESTEARLKRERSEEKAVGFAAVGSAARRTDYTRAPTTACPVCNTKGHWAKDCPKAVRGGGARGGEKTCFKCGQSGHIARTCPTGSGSGSGSGSGPAQASVTFAF